MIIGQLKEKIILSFILLAGLMLGTSVSFAEKACSWTGSWNTSKGKLELNQQGNEVKGKFTDKNLNIEGLVSGRFFIGAWDSSESTEAGNINMIMSEDCTNLKADRNYSLKDSNINWDYNSITGQKVSSTDDTDRYSLNDSIVKSFTIGDRSIAFAVDDNWIYKVDNDKNILITSKQYPEDIAIYVLNQVFKYRNMDEKKLFFQGQLAEAKKLSKGDVTVNTKPLKGRSIDMIKIPQEGMKTVIILPDTGNSYYMITATYTDSKKMATAEPLLKSIMEGIFRSQ